MICDIFIQALLAIRYYIDNIIITPLRKNLRLLFNSALWQAFLVSRWKLQKVSESLKDNLLEVVHHYDLMHLQYDFVDNLNINRYVKHIIVYI